MIAILSLLAFVYIAVGLLLYINQRSFLYFPTPSVRHDFDELHLNNEDESIRTLVVNPGKEKAILYFGGNGESVAFSAPDLSSLFPSYSLYLVNYRGYGGSSGKPEEKGLYSDAQYIFDQVKRRHHDVSVIGRSLGTAVATLLASKKDVSKLVLITPFDSIQNVAQQKFWMYPMSMLLRDKFDSLSRVKEITAQTLIIIAENDEVIERKHTENLIKAFPVSQRTVEIIKSAGHNTLSADKRYSLLLKKYLE